MRTLLVTGGAGFIGSNFIKWMLERHADIQIVNLDLLTYAGNLENLKEVEKHPSYTFVRADIRDREKLEQLFQQFSFDTVVNFAAESHVDRSILTPDVFMTTNVLGTQALLDVAKKHWMIHPEDKYCRAFREGVRFLQVSTDEVYGTLGAEGAFSESMPLLPNSPYSASKAGADLLVRAYHETYGLPVSITRCSNNYGPFQFPEKLIPLMIYHCISGKKLPVYGDGLQIRDWLHVRDHCGAIETVLEKGVSGEVYNIGGNNEKTNLELVKRILQTLGKSDDQIAFVQDRLGHDRRYAIDNTKITTRLGWRPAYTFEQGLQDTIQWYVENTEWIEHILSGEYTADAGAD